MKAEIVEQIKTAIQQELSDTGRIVIEDLYNNELLAGLSMTTIDAVVHNLCDAGEIELV